MRYETKGINEMPKWMYWVLAVAFAWLIWTNFLKPVPDLDQLKTQQNVQIIELEKYEGSFRVLSKEDYHWGREAEFSPIDIAVGWGEMAKPQVYEHIDISQSNRWYYWRYENNPPIPLNDIASSSANTHLIPANKVVAQKLADIDVDDMVYLKGQLVEVKSADGWTWRSSLSRTDTGNGACELMLVEEVREISSL